jgi:hypothetical protein
MVIIMGLTSIAKAIRSDVLDESAFLFSCITALALMADLIDFFRQNNEK